MERKVSTRTYRWLHATLGRLILWYFRVQVRGLENVPDAPVIFVAPHKAVIDSYVIVAALDAKRSTKFLAKSEYFDDGGIKQRVIRWLVGQAAIPVDRDDKSSGQAALGTLVEELRSGGSGAVHPEGTRSLEPGIFKAKPGFVYTAWATGVPVVPVLLRGTEEANPPGQRVLRRHTIEIEFLLPRYLHEPKAIQILEGTKVGRDKLDLLRRRLAARQAKEVMELIAQRLGMHYVDEDIRARQKRLNRY